MIQRKSIFFIILGPRCINEVLPVIHSTTLDSKKTPISIREHSHRAHLIKNSKSWLQKHSVNYSLLPDASYVTQIPTVMKFQVTLIRKKLANIVSWMSLTSRSLEI